MQPVLMNQPTKAARPGRFAQTFADMRQQRMARPARPAAQPVQAMQGAPTAPVAQPVQQLPQRPAAPAPAPVQPAPQPVQPVPQAPQAPQTGGVYTRPVNSLDPRVRAALEQSLANPSAYNADEANATFARLNRSLREGFDADRQTLNEDMARRGLFSSTIAATKLGELGDRQALRQSDLAGQVHENMVRDLATARSNAIAQAMAHGQAEEGNSLEAFKANENARQFGLEHALRSALGMGGLALQGQEAANRMTMFDKELAFKREDNSAERQLKEMLGLKDANLRADQLRQQGSQFDRELGQKDDHFGRDEAYRREQAARDEAFRKEQLGQGNLNSILQFANLLGIDKFGAGGGLDELFRRFGMNAPATPPSSTGGRFVPGNPNVPEFEDGDYRPRTPYGTRGF